MVKGGDEVDEFSEILGWMMNLMKGRDEN